MTEKIRIKIPVTVLTDEDWIDRFGCYPEDMQPSGTYNSSTLSTVCINLTLDEETGILEMPPMPESTMTPEKLERFKNMFLGVRKGLGAEGG